MAISSLRDRVLSYLGKTGAVEDRSGKATAKLRGALGYDGSNAAFTQQIAMMERAGDLSRVVRGRRTYRIELAGEYPKDESIEDRASVVRSEVMADISESAGPGSDVDYDELAGALLLRVVRTLSSSVEGIESRSWATRRIERTQERNDDLKRSLARIKAEMDAITVERDELRDRLANSEKNLLLLEERLTNGKVHSGSIATRLGAEERLLLHQLRNPTAAISNKAG